MMFIKKTTKLLGDPCIGGHGGSLASKINEFLTKVLSAVGFFSLKWRVVEFISVKLYGSFVCGYRHSQKNVFGREYDHWQFTGKDLTCSYCGSMHPDQFEKVVDHIIANPDDNSVSISIADGGHKVYVTRAGIRNAAYGAIKFYATHGPRGDAYQTFREKVNKASGICWDRFEKERSTKWEKVKDDLNPQVVS